MRILTILSFLFLLKVTIGQNQELYLHRWDHKKTIKLPGKKNTPFIRFTYTTSINSITSIVKQLTISGKIINVDSTSITINVRQESYTINDPHGASSDGTITYLTDDGKELAIPEIRTVNFSDITSVYDSWSSPAVGAGGVITFISGVSALFIAPLASINYSTGDINSHRYYSIVAGATATGLLIGVPLMAFFQRDDEYTTTVTKTETDAKKTFYISNH